MRILALDAATEACSVALLDGTEVTEQFIMAPREHAQRLLPMAEQLLAASALTLGQLDAIAVGQGPGAFTGIRIAMGIAQGLALGADLPIATVSCLQAQAFRSINKQGADKVLVVQDARMQEIYWAAYTANASNAPQVTGPGEQVGPPESVSLAGDARKWQIAGNGWLAYPERLAELRRAVNAGPQPSHPHAEDIACLGRLLLASGAVVSADQARPVYIRNNVARPSKR